MSFVQEHYIGAYYTKYYIIIIILSALSVIIIIIIISVVAVTLGEFQRRRRTIRAYCQTVTYINVYAIIKGLTLYILYINVTMLYDTRRVCVVSAMPLLSVSVLM